MGASEPEPPAAGEELLAALRALPRSGLGVPTGRARFQRPNHDLALMVRLDAFVEANGGGIVVVKPSGPTQVGRNRLFKAARPSDRYYDVPSKLVD